MLRGSSDTSTRGGNAVNPPSAIGRICPFAGGFFYFQKLSEKRRIEMSVDQKSMRTTMKKMNGDSLTPILIFRRLAGKQKFLLESSLKHDGSGRYSFMGMDPLKSFQGSGNELEEYIYESKKKYVHTGDVLVLLKRLLPRIDNDIDFPFTGGAVGYVGYGAGRNVEGGPVDDLGLPDIHLNVYETIIVFDHLLNEVTILRTETGAVQGTQSLDELAAIISSNAEKMDSDFELGEFTCQTTQEEYENLVRKGKEYIRNGEVEQVVLSRRLEADFQGDPFSLYRKLRKKNPSPYMYYMDFDDYVIVGASPESLVKVTGGKMMINPIAGTRRRGKDEAEDAALVKELLADPKELAEHDMLVKLGRYEAEEVCVPGTIDIMKYRKVVSYEHVMHLVSEVEGTLSPALHPLDALTTCLPAGTVTGSPKKRAMEIIDELEDVHRGIYGGAIGYIGFNGNMDFALTIRTMLIRNEKAYVQAGAGIVAASDPEMEFMETVNKARSLVDVMK